MNNCVCKGAFTLDRDYVVGENRPLFIKASDSERDVFAITGATYEVINKRGDVIGSGACEIDNDKHTFGFMFHPPEAGVFTIEFEVTIPPEVRIIDCTAKVRKQGEAVSR